MTLACDEKHEKVFPDVPIIGFKNNDLKSHLLRAALSDINEVGRYQPCSGKRPHCQLCCNIKNTNTFKREKSNKENF